MKCPKCGADMVVTNHRRYPMWMCYYCGYMEGRNMEIDNSMRITVAQTFNRMNEDDMALFLSQCDFKGASFEDVRAWMDVPLIPFTQDMIKSKKEAKEEKAAE